MTSSRSVRRRLLALSIACVASVGAAGSAAAGSGFVYALQDVTGGANQVHGFRLNGATGELAALPGFPRASGGNGGGIGFAEHVAYDALNGRLYVVNDGSETLSAFSVDRVTGALTALSFSPLDVGFPIALLACVAVHPTGSPVLVGADTGGSAPSRASLPRGPGRPWPPAARRARTRCFRSRAPSAATGASSTPAEATRAAASRGSA
jgi:hypothetical protein